jgi:hypothetical protein
MKFSFAPSRRPDKLLERDVPPLSLRGGNALDNYSAPPAFDPELDQPTPEYFEANYWGISHLDPVSWCFYVPLLVAYALQNISNMKSMAIDAFLASLRPPDREPPRLEALSPEQKAAVVAMLDRLAFDDASVWKEPAMTALEEYWAPGALYRKDRRSET